jgi:hypothetical protein
VSRAPLPNSGVTSVGETWSVSWEGVTPPSSLILAHAPLPLSSLLLRLLASFGESLQVVASPCCPRQLPDVIPRIGPWMLDPLPRRYTVCSRLFLPRCHRPSPTECGSASRVYPANDFSQGNVSRMQIFRNVPASKFARPPDRPYRCEYYRRAARAFTSGHIVLCCRRTHQIC